MTSGNTALLVGITLLAALALRFFMQRRTMLSPDQIQELKQRGALVVDVRSTGEFAGGSVPGSVNIPMDQIPDAMGQWAKDQALLLCCASGVRSAHVQRYLQQEGYTDVHNAGPWQRAL